SIQLSLASPEEIVSWSSGEITKPETINYRSQKPEKEGLFSEQVFGPTKDYECSCGKYRGMRYRGIVCDKCHVEITRSIVRRQRMGHVELAVPVAHIWFLRNIPSRVALVLDKTLQEIERVIYYSSYIITEVDEDLRKQYMKQVENEYKKKYEELTGSASASEEQITQLKEARDQNMDYLNRMKKHNVISEVDYRLMASRFGGAFKAETGSEVLRDIFS
ncbi:MAG: DNA-directed RNA polymerase subunit beta', partial [Candidatus Paceibacteria bacterium]